MASLSSSPMAGNASSGIHSRSRLILRIHCSTASFQLSRAQRPAATSRARILAASSAGGLSESFSSRTRSRKRVSYRATTRRGYRVVDHGVDFLEVLWKKLAQPLFFDRRGQIQHDIQGAVSAAAAFHLAHLGSDEKRRFHNALAGQYTAPAMDQFTTAASQRLDAWQDGRKSQPAHNAAQ